MKCTGKSTISNFLYRSDDPTFAHCAVSRQKPDGVRVYKQALAVIFSLSLENKAAEQKIAAAAQKVEALRQALQAKDMEIDVAEAHALKRRGVALIRYGRSRSSSAEETACWSIASKG